jgi:hypothetical protein
MSAPELPAEAEDWMRQPEVSCAEPGPGAIAAAAEGDDAVATPDGVTAAAMIDAAHATKIKGDLTIDNRTSPNRTLSVTALPHPIINLLNNVRNRTAG